MDCLRQIKPMLAESFDKSKLMSFDFSNYLAEIKWDGTRAISFVCSDGNKLQNRRFTDITKRYPDIQVKLKEGVNEAILDGEIVVMVNGVPDFNSLQHREHIDNSFKIQQVMKTYPASYVIFDIIYVDGRDVTSLPLIERKKLLKEVVIDTDNVCVCDYITGNVKEYFELVVNKKLEGVMVKRIDSPYVIGKRVGYWLKVKKKDNIEAIVCGITPGEGWREKYFGALVLGCYENGKLRYVGKVGTGLAVKDLMEFIDLFKSVPESEPMFKVDDDVKKWFKPQVVIEVEFLEMTKDKKLREPRYMRRREDKDALECVC